MEELVSPAENRHEIEISPAEHHLLLMKGLIFSILRRSWSHLWCPDALAGGPDHKDVGVGERPRADLLRSEERRVGKECLL